VLRDVATTGLALYGVWHQESSGRVNPWLLLMYAVMLSLIPASHAVALLRGSSEPSLPPQPAPVTAPMPPS
jgi:hypothetical protein